MWFIDLKFYSLFIHCFNSKSSDLLYYSFHVLYHLFYDKGLLKDRYVNASPVTQHGLETLYHNSNGEWYLLETEHCRLLNKGMSEQSKDNY